MLAINTSISLSRQNPSCRYSTILRDTPPDHSIEQLSKLLIDSHGIPQACYPVSYPSQLASLLLPDLPSLDFDPTLKPELGANTTPLLHGRHHQRPCLLQHKRHVGTDLSHVPRHRQDVLKSLAEHQRAKRDETYLYLNSSFPERRNCTCTVNWRPVLEIGSYTGYSAMAWYKQHGDHRSKNRPPGAGNPEIIAALARTFDTYDFNDIERPAQVSVGNLGGGFDTVLWIQ